jgi:hypothetical protein
MPMVERVRECVSGLPAPEYFAERSEAGWRLTALEWEHDAEPRGPAPSLHEVPFGFRIAADCVHLEDNPDERRALTVMMEIITQDRPLSQVATELNRRGFRTRQETAWTPLDVFNLLPRLVETGPAIFVSPEWAARPRHATP